MTYEPIRIGDKVLTLEKVKKDFAETKRALNAQELSILLDNAWADSALVAHVLDLPRSRVTKWCKSGKIIAVKKLGNWYIQLEQFREVFFLESMPGRFATPKEKKHIPRYIKGLGRDFFRELQANKVAPLSLRTGKGDKPATRRRSAKR